MIWACAPNRNLELRRSWPRRLILEYGPSSKAWRVKAEQIARSKSLSI